MKLIANAVNGKYLWKILPDKNQNVDAILAAIAYGSEFNTQQPDRDLIENCLQHGCRMDIWMRYEGGLTVAPELLQRFLNNQKNDIFLRLVPDWLHSKVIWWQGYGAYIGSANLTDRAWVDNIEAGLFLEENELLESGVKTQLDDFFSYLKEKIETHPISQELIVEAKEYQKLRNTQENKEKTQKRIIPKQSNPHSKDKKKASDYQEGKFQKEWYDTLGYLQSISELLEARRPSWIDENIPPNWHIDQFYMPIIIKKLLTRAVENLLRNFISKIKIAQLLR